MCLVTSKCVPKSNGFVFTLACISNSILSFLNYIVSLFLFLPVLFFLFEFVLPFLTFLSEFVFLSPSLYPPFIFFPSAFVLPVPTFSLPVLILTFSS